MNKDARIIVTGAAGFIGSCMVGYLNQNGFENIILVDKFGDPEKEKNLERKTFSAKIDRDDFEKWLSQNEVPAVIFHLGARTDTTEFDYSIHEILNVEYSKMIWKYCAFNNIPLIYASSAATYGNGDLGYSDDHQLPEKLKPLNPYGISKNEFDKWALVQKTPPVSWYGLKFFNVYGPNEYHKARMASVIFHSVRQIREQGSVKLFRSHKEEFRDGEQLRDFIYVKDLLKVCYWLWENQPESGLYNLGTGKARHFNDLVRATFTALDKDPVIEYINMPEDLRDSYQYFTEAEMQKLTSAGYFASFYTLEEGISDYVKNYLAPVIYY